MSFYTNPSSSQPIHTNLFDPLRGIYEKASHRRSCPTVSDEDWIEIGVRRVLGADRSGCGFLERLSDESDFTIEKHNFFKSLKSKRRLQLLEDMNDQLERIVHEKLSPTVDPFAQVPALDKFDLYAGDGHYVEKACHDKPVDGKHFASGQFFGLNLRSHGMFQITHADRGQQRKREHDMHALKRLSAEELRRGAPKGVRGRKVLWVWDRAGIDAHWWTTMKRQHGIYFVSRSKSNMDLTPRGDLPYDDADPVNVGVTGNYVVYVASVALRCVAYTCPVTNESFHFLTTLTSDKVPPGAIAMLYKARWDIEKVFDETKKKLEENKAWGTTQTAKDTQACFVSITHNLLLLMEQHLADDHDVTQVTEEKRRDKRLARHGETAQKRQQKLSKLWESLFRRATQRTRSFIRWIRNNLQSERPYSELIATLKRRYGQI